MSSSNNVSSSSQTKPSLFSPAELSKCYAKKDKNYPCHYLIARSDKSTLSSLKAGDQLIAHDPHHYAWTPLIIATISQDEKVVEELLKHKNVIDHINDADAHGWTALHHAALASDAIFQKLIAAGAKQNCQTQMRATPEDLRALTTWNLQGESMENVFFEGKPLTQERAKEAFDMQGYRNRPYFGPEFLKDLWQQTESEDDNPRARSIKEQSKSKPPKVNIELLPQGFYGLSAAEPVPIGTFIGQYGGAFVNNESDYRSFPDTFPPKNDKDAYLFVDFDGKHVGNATRFINNGFPNVLPFCVIEGGVNNNVLIAAETVEEGEPFLFNYGGKAYAMTYGGPQILFNRDKIHAFFRPGMASILKERAELEKQKSTTSYLQKSLLEQRVMFALDNPICLIDLHFSKVIEMKEWLKLLIENNTPMIESWEEQHGSQLLIHLKETLTRLLEVEQKIAAKGAEHHLRFQNWILDQCQKLSLIDLMKGVDAMEKELGLANPEMDKSDLYNYKNRKNGFNRHVDFSLLVQRSTNDSNFFNVKKSQLAKALEGHGGNPHFPGSELEKMICAIRDEAPKTEEGRAKYLAKVKADFQAIQHLTK